MAYVAVTRARRLLVASTHAWRPGDVNRREPSPYFLTLDGDPTPMYEATSNPLSVSTEAVPWPAPADPDLAARRRSAAALVSRLRVGAADRDDAHREVDALAAAAPDETAVRLASWETDVEALLAEAHRQHVRVVDVPMPDSLTASEVMLAVSSPQDLAARLARPMPRPPSQSARFGTRFHEWVLRHYEAPVLIDPDELLDLDDDTDADLREMCRAFAATLGRWSRTPASSRSRCWSGPRSCGRIDAAWPSPVTPGFDALVVDWKTASAPDPLQLALYRLAWAELHDLAPGRGRFTTCVRTVSISYGPPRSRRDRSPGERSRSLIAFAGVGTIL